jgi:hypothetical protein
MNLDLRRMRLLAGTAVQLDLSNSEPHPLWIIEITCVIHSSGLSFSVQQTLNQRAFVRRNAQTNPAIPASAPAPNSQSGFHGLRRTTATVRSVIK